MFLAIKGAPNLCFRGFFQIPQISEKVFQKFYDQNNREKGNFVNRSLPIGSLYPLKEKMACDEEI